MKAIDRESYNKKMTKYKVCSKPYRHKRPVKPHTMKCVRSIHDEKDAFRCSAKKAKELVESGYYKYTSKKVWKANGRRYK